MDFTNELLKNFVEKLRPQDEEIRKKLDMGYSWDGSMVLLYEIRPQWDNPKNILHHNFAKIRFYKSRGEWNLYWPRAGGKWEAYEPYPVAKHLQKLLDVIEEDKHHCFFG
ncbi:MAG: DUF3024 domain-containing protein [Moheibacter sp.]